MKWDFEDCKNSALKYNTRNEWAQGERGAYVRSLKEKWIDEITVHMNGRLKWTREACKASALTFTTMTDWKLNEGGAYEACKRNKWQSFCCGHFTRKVKWTEESCKESALQFTTRKAWQKGAAGAHKASKKLGCFDSCVAHMALQRRPKLDLEDCKASASKSKYKTRTEWAKADPSAYRASRKKGWLENVTAHMPRKRSPL